MKNNTSIQLSARQYFQGSSILSLLEEHIESFGNMALIISDKNVFPKVENKINTIFKKSKASYCYHNFENYCSPFNINPAVKTGKDNKVCFVIGVGGGKIIDTAKIVADKLGLPSIVIPTSAATCACTALLAVEYADDGKFIGNYWPQFAPTVVLADLDIIVKDCPQEYTVAGIVDAMAKYLEIMFNIQHSEVWGKNIYSSIAYTSAKETYNLYINTAESALKKIKQGIIDDEVENIIASSLSITGLISCCAFGGRQAAMSHSIYSYVCNEHPDIAKKYVHGTIVGASLIFQAAVNGCSEEEIKKLSDFFKVIGQPLNLAEIGLSHINVAAMFEYVFQANDITNNDLKATIIGKTSYLL